MEYAFMKKKGLFISVLLVLVITFTGCTTKTGTTTPTDLSTPPTETTVPSGSEGNPVYEIETILESVYAKTNQSVVNIQVSLPASLFSSESGGLGSGFVWDNQGHIVTNNHVTESASRITVTFYDGSTVEASLVGADADSDLAVIKVDMSDVNANGIQLQPVEIADSTQLKVGQIAIAIGNPFGLQGTMTVGFISGLGRLISANDNTIGPTYRIPDIIQTDAAVNPGNSGGVLLDRTGKLIGVTNSIATTTGTDAGVGFAIPSAIVQQVVPALIESGHYNHPYLGISLISLTPDLSEAMDLASTQRGALVETVTADSPADKAGLQASENQVTINGQQIGIGGDVIIAFNGQTVKSSDDLIAYLARSGVVGQTATLTVLRDGKQMELQVTLGARPSS
jgi:S1-C subfamily serine protease